MAHFIDKNCVRCGDCVPICPNQAIEANEPHYLIDSDVCLDCKVCISVCPTNAIHPIK